MGYSQAELMSNRAGPWGGGDLGQSTSGSPETVARRGDALGNMFLEILKKQQHHNSSRTVSTFS